MKKDFVNISENLQEIVTGEGRFLKSFWVSPWNQTNSDIVTFTRIAVNHLQYADAVEGLYQTLMMQIFAEIVNGFSCQLFWQNSIRERVLNTSFIYNQLQPTTVFLKKNTLLTALMQQMWHFFCLFFKF